jgi:hypothetical protein
MMRRVSCKRTSGNLSSSRKRSQKYRSVISPWSLLDKTKRSTGSA